MVPYGQNLNFILPITFNSAIRQTLTPPNIPAIEVVNNTQLNCDLYVFSTV